MDDSEEPATIADKLLNWYRCNARLLPWREPPGSDRRPPAYRVWLSEVMLQQTTTTAAAPFYARFLERWPDVEALAAAPVEQVMAQWAGLGYYARARNLVDCARQVAADGGFPEEEDELRRLPGIGTYTAAAIAAIAFGRRAVVVDTNVERVVARLFAIDQPLPGARRAIREATAHITPEHRAGDFAQGMMDLGAAICTPRSPDCPQCPLVHSCRAYEQGRAHQLPVRPAKRDKPARRGQAYVIVRDGGVFVVTRPPGGMLGGMRALPDDGWSARANGTCAAPFPGGWRLVGQVRHGFTHFMLELEVLMIEIVDDVDLPPGEWIGLNKLSKIGLPTVFAKALALAVRLPDTKAGL